MRTATNTSRWLLIAALLSLCAACVSAQTFSRSAALSLSATVLPNLKLQPRVFSLQDGDVSAQVIPESAEQFVVHARITGDGNRVLEIPVSVSSNVKSFVVSASADDEIAGTVQMLGSSKDRITLLSNQKPLQSFSTFALGLPGPGRASANGSFDGVIQVALTGLPKGETKEVRIRLSISQN